MLTRRKLITGGAALAAYGALRGGAGASPLVGALQQQVRNRSAGGGPDAWYYTADWIESTTGGPISTGWAPQSYAYGNDVVVGTAGTATTISIRMSHNSVAVNIKMALFDSSGNLVASGTGATTTSDSAGAWVDVTVNAAVSAATYYIHVSAATSDGWPHYVSSGTEDGHAITVEYASAWADPSTINTESGNNFGARIYVD